MEGQKYVNQSEYDPLYVQGIIREVNDIETGRIPRSRYESIIPFDLDVDGDGFKRYKPELLQEQCPKRNNLIRGTVPIVHLRTSLKHHENRTLHSFLPLNPTSPALANPLLNSNVPFYSSELASYPTSTFPYPVEYGVPVTRDEIRESTGVEVDEVLNNFIPSNYTKPTLTQPKTVLKQTNRPQLVFQCIRKEELHLNEGIHNKTMEFKVEKAKEKPIGGLSVSERRQKIQRYLVKKKKRLETKKDFYDSRKKAAHKRLRIKGRFVTKEEACAVLGITLEQLNKNELLQGLIKKDNDCSIVTSAQNMKIRNLQTLLNNSTKGIRKDKVKTEVMNNDCHQTNEFNVEILAKNVQENTVEVKIKPITKVRNDAAHNLQIVNQSSDTQTLQLASPPFQCKRLKPEKRISNDDEYKE